MKTFKILIEDELTKDELSELENFVNKFAFADKSQCDDAKAPSYNHKLVRILKRYITRIGCKIEDYNCDVKTHILHSSTFKNGYSILCRDVITSIKFDVQVTDDTLDYNKFMRYLTVLQVITRDKIKPSVDIY